ncbi:MAG: hypothetical protein H8E46_12920 [FCB group bacterium]|nr:hypothetical protein [FCB group bacterium]
MDGFIAVIQDENRNLRFADQRYRYLQVIFAENRGNVKTADFYTQKGGWNPPDIVSEKTGGG